MFRYVFGGLMVIATASVASAGHKVGTVTRTIIALAIQAALLSWPTSTAAGPYTFTKIADTNSEQFGRISGVPSINNNGEVVFFGCQVDCGNDTGFYKGDGVIITTIVETVSNFENLGPNVATINDHGNVAFSGILDTGLGPRWGVFVGDGGPLTIIADESASLDVFGAPFINSSDLVAFRARILPDRTMEGVFSGFGGPVTTIFSHTIGGLNGALSINSLGDVAFILEDEILVGSGGPLDIILDTSEQFQKFAILSLNDQGVIAFQAGLDSGVWGIFSVSDGVVKTIADNRGPFNGFGNISLNNLGDVAFVASLDAGGTGIFIGPDPISHKVIATGDPLFGSHLVELVFFNGINDFGQIVFRGILADGTEGIYRADIPPSDNVSKSLVWGPWRDDGFGGLEPFDLDGDLVPDEGNVIGVGLSHAQHYAFAIDIENQISSVDVNQLTFLDVIPEGFALDPVGEEWETGDVCGGGECDGVLADPSCPVTISGPRLRKNEIDPRYIVIEPATVGDGATCRTLIFVATAQSSSKGNKKNQNESFPPEECQLAATQIGEVIANTVNLNSGVKVFGGDALEFRFGPIDPIQLVPVGCP